LPTGRPAHAWCLFLETTNRLASFAVSQMVLDEIRRRPPHASAETVLFLVRGFVSAKEKFPISAGISPQFQQEWNGAVIVLAIGER
jgi:hypothetical protein